ncbi:MAG: hypothetical protein NTZ90_15015 [Proteobacteria bacterium]|nr:hypothetical protein [Pseudomonadota bacterium]
MALAGSPYFIDAMHCEGLDETISRPNSTYEHADLCINMPT